MRIIAILLTMFLCALAGAAQDTCNKYRPAEQPYYFCLPQGLVAGDKDDRVETFVKPGESGPDRYMLSIRVDSRLNWNTATAWGYDLIKRAYNDKDFSNVLLKEIGTVNAGEEFEAIRLVYDMDRVRTGKHVRRIQFVFSGAVKLVAFTFDIPADSPADIAAAEKTIKANLVYKLH